MDKKVINDLKAILRIEVKNQRITAEIEGDVGNMLVNVMRYEKEIRDVLLKAFSTFLQHHPELFVEFLKENPQKGFDFMDMRECDKIPDEYKGLTLGAPKAEC